MNPVDLSINDENSLVIHWSDGLVQTIPVASLRKQCPCANCRAQRMDGDDEPPPESTTQPESPDTSTGFRLPVVSGPVSIERMAPMGNYAYNIRFSDGHQTGIFSFEFLRQVS